MEINLVSESLKFMVLGMMIVFVFLFLLVQLMRLQAYLINKYFPDPTETSSTSMPGASSSDNGAHVAAIIAAISEYKKQKSN